MIFLQNDRIFWIYVVISLFFFTIGSVYLANTTNQWLITPWFFSNFALCYIAYTISHGFQSLYKKILPNGLYFVLMVLGCLWCSEYNSKNNSFKNILPILMIIGGFYFLVLIKSMLGRIDIFSPCFWMIVAYFFFWFVISVYTSVIV